MTIRQTIKRAEATLGGPAKAVGDRDPRWQAILSVGQYSQSNPEAVWSFIERWGQHEDADLRTAVGLCLLEHLLGYHFELIFSRVEQLAVKSSRFADTFRYCRKMGEAEGPQPTERWDALLARLNAEPAA
jgi:hypothetical protein